MWFKCKLKPKWDAIIHWLVKILKKTNYTKYWLECGTNGTPLTILCKCKLAQPLWKMVWHFPKNLNVYLQYDQVIPLQGIYARENKAYVHYFIHKFL